jgi:hypothetical protein
MYYRTSLVRNEDAKIKGLEPFYYRERTWNTQPLPYQTLQIIQNSVRVPASTYTTDLAALSVSKQPVWNALSDRPVPANPGYTRKTTSRPGGQAPGGKGCDVKHGSYERYLNRLKGKGPLRRNVQASVDARVTGRTTVVAGCKCDATSDQLIYTDRKTTDIDGIQYEFAVGDQVYAKQTGSNYYSRAIVVSNDGNNMYTIRYDYDEVVETKYISELKIFTCCG